MHPSYIKYLCIAGIFCCLFGAMENPLFAATGMEWPADSAFRDNPRQNLYDHLSLEGTTSVFKWSEDTDSAFGKTNIDANEESLFLGQHRKSRKKKSGGGALWVNFYLADTVIDDPRYTDLTIKPDLWGAQIGYDVKFGYGGTSRLGVFYNYNNTYMKWFDFESPYGMRWSEQNHLFGVTYTSRGALAHFQICGSVGYDQYDVITPGYDPVPYTDAPDQFVPAPNWTGDGFQGNIYAELGLDLIPDDESWAFMPFLAFDYNYLYRDKLKDSIWGSIAKDDCNAFKSILGIRVNKRFGHYIQLQGRAAWLQQLLKHNDPISNQNFSMLSGTRTPTVYLYDAEQGNAFVWIGATLKFYVADTRTTGTRIYLDYDLVINKNCVSHLGNLGFLFTW